MLFVNHATCKGLYLLFSIIVLNAANDYKLLTLVPLYGVSTLHNCGHSCIFWEHNIIACICTCNKVHVQMII